MIVKYELHFLQCGNTTKGGDAIFFHFEDEENVDHVAIIDGGYHENGKEIVKMMRSRGLEKIDYVFNTHPDIDHISGLFDVFAAEDISIEKLVMNCPWKDADFGLEEFEDGRITFNSLKKRLQESFGKAYELVKIAEKRGISVTHPVLGTTYFNGVLQIVGPSKAHYESFLINSKKTPATIGETKAISKATTYEPETYDRTKTIKWLDDAPTSEINETSVIMILSLPNHRILLTGDAGKNALYAADSFMRSKGISRDFSVVQLPHHGSRKNISPDILCLYRADQYMISCPPLGMKNGHPSRRLINKIHEMFPSSSVYMTLMSSLHYDYNYDLPGRSARECGVYDEMDGVAI